MHKVHLKADLNSVHERLAGSHLKKDGEPSTAMAFTPDMRDFEKNPYSPDEARVAKYLCERTGGSIGGGDDPIGFLIASHAFLGERVKDLSLNLRTGDKNGGGPW